MANPASFRGVYKTLGSQEIDTDIYLPEVVSDKNNGKCPVRK